MVAGDGVLIWNVRDNAGIYALTEIIEPPKIIGSSPDIGYWIDARWIGTKPFTKIRFTSKLLEKPMLREHLKQDIVLKILW